MNAVLHRYGRRVWQGDAGWLGGLVRLLLLPLSGLWRGVTAVRNARWNRVGGTCVERLAVVSVGNLAVGGTGKTPIASWVVRALLASGHRPALLLSGYGRDEELLHRRWTPRVHVISDPDRTAGARAAAVRGCDVAVLDDGFQHRRLDRRLDLVLLAVEDAFPGPVLPRGPYREPSAALRRADGVILTRRRAPLAEARALEERVSRQVAGSATKVLASVHLVTASLTPLSDGQDREDPELESPHDSELESPHDPELESPHDPELESPLAVTAISRPDAFLRDVASLAKGRVELLAFVDHHDFSRRDARDMRQRAGERPIVITEKDAVKLTDHADVLGEVWVLRQRLAWDWGEADIRGLLESAVPSRQLREGNA